MKIGLALSGGGARGIAHLGAIKALQEHDFSFSHVSGVSAGSIVGAFFCAGYPPEEILQILNKTSLYQIVRPAMNWRGLLRLDKVINQFKGYFPEDSFQALKIPLYIPATDVSSGKTTYFSKGPLMQVILASSSIPVVFDPVKIEDTYYVDGGILNNLPVEPLKEECDKIVGIHTNPIRQTTGPVTMRNLIERSLMMAINCNIEPRRSLCDLFIEPEGLNKFGVFDIKKSAEIFDIGYTHTHKMLEETPAIIENFTD